MLIVLIARDRPGQLSLRQEVRAAHLNYLRSTGVVTQAGPLIDEAGEMCGSLLVLELLPHHGPGPSARTSWTCLREALPGDHRSLRRLEPGAKNFLYCSTSNGNPKLLSLI